MRERDFHRGPVLLVLPPMTQVNTPYPSTAYLTGFLRKQGVNAIQSDVGMELFNRLFSRKGLISIHDEVLRVTRPSERIINPALRQFILNFAQYHGSIESILSFVRGRDPSLHYRILNGTLLPKDSEAEKCHWQTEGYQAALGRLSEFDVAMNRAGYFLQDICQVLTVLDPEFQFSRYGERLTNQSITYDGLFQRLSESNIIDSFIEEIIRDLVIENRPKLLCMSVPFPGNLYSALRMGSYVKKNFPEVKVALGGGFCNTSLRCLNEPRVFDAVDYICLDDGEKPLLFILEHLEGVRTRENLLRTFVREGDSVRFVSSKTEKDFSHAEAGTPTYDGLDLGQYFPQVFHGYNLNPFVTMCNSYHWNKLTVAHGCYWKKCTFCDIHLDYIGRYNPISATVLVDRIEALIDETGSRAFHFVDEACPPSTLTAMSKLLIERKIEITWYGNIRFDKAFTSECAKLLARAGCIMVTGGLEVASDRILKLMDKGTTVQQVARVAKAFADAKIMVHAYLIYAFPSQTLQEIIDSLELVRQFFDLGLIQSAVWHEFSVTAHSPIGREPAKYGVQMETTLPPNLFSFYTISQKGGYPFFHLGPGLRKAVSCYMLDSGFKRDLRDWFDVEVPPPSVSHNFIKRCLSHPEKIVRRKAKPRLKDTETQAECHA